MEESDLENLFQQLELVKDYIKGSALAAHKRNMNKGCEMTKLLLEHTRSEKDPLTKEEVFSPSSRTRKPAAVAAATATSVVPASGPIQLCYTTPTTDLERWFSTPGVLSCQDEIARATNHPLFPEFLAAALQEAEESWVFGGEDEENDPYADLYSFMEYVRLNNRDRGSEDCGLFFCSSLKFEVEDTSHCDLPVNL